MAVYTQKKRGLPPPDPRQLRMYHAWPATAVTSAYYVNYYGY